MTINVPLTPGDIIQSTVTLRRHVILSIDGDVVTFECVEPHDLFFKEIGAFTAELKSVLRYGVMVGKHQTNPLNVPTF